MPDFPDDASALTHLLVVSDLDRARDWYANVLKAEVTGEYGGTSVVLKLLGNWLLIVTGGGPTPDKPGVTFAPPADPARAQAQIIFRVADANHTYKTLKARGAEFLTPPVHYDHGETRAFFRDPDGHLFEISSLTEGPTPVRAEQSALAASGIVGTLYVRDPYRMCTEYIHGA